MDIFTIQKQEGGIRIEKPINTSRLNIPLISIVTVVLNGERFLEETIKSVITQNYKNFEYIIIDGASTDGTLSIIKKYSQHIDYWISEPDQGIYEAMNKGIHVSKGACVGLLNCGDCYNEETLTIVSEHISRIQEKHFVITGGLIKINEMGQNLRAIIRDETILKRKFTLMPLNHPATFISSSIYNDLGVYNIKYKISSDYEFILKLLHFNIKIIFTPYILTRMRAGGISEMSKTFLLRLKEGFEIRRKYKGCIYSLAIAMREILSFIFTTGKLKSAITH